MNEFLDYIQSLNPNYELEGIKKAYELAAEMHEGQLRKSGEPYLIHPVEVAKILAGLGMDEQTIIAGLLHEARFWRRGDSSRGRRDKTGKSHI